MCPNRWNSTTWCERTSSKALQRPWIKQIWAAGQIKRQKQQVAAMFPPYFLRDSRSPQPGDLFLRSSVQQSLKVALASRFLTARVSKINRSHRRRKSQPNAPIELHKNSCETAPKNDTHHQSQRSVARPVCHPFKRRHRPLRNPGQSLIQPQLKKNWQLPTSTKGTHITNDATRIDMNFNNH